MTNPTPFARDKHATAIAETLQAAVDVCGSQRKLAARLGLAPNTVNRWTRVPLAVPAWALLDMWVMSTNKPTDTA